MKNSNEFKVQKYLFAWLRNVLPILIFTFLCTSVTGQDTMVSGSVTDESGTPLPGANIVEKGTTNGVTADFDGNFSINASNDKATLIVSYIGFTTKEIAVNGQSFLSLILSESAAGLDEVVVIGYGSIKKKDLTGSVASIRSEDINSVPTGPLARSIQGRASGVQVQQNSGAPGSGMQIRIRGTNSISGSNEPLWIIDGFPGDQNAINANDIESMEILKDASATAIYGSRGANGVIIITTKSGKTGKTKVSYESSFGLQKVRNKLDLLNPQEYMRFVNIQQVNDLGEAFFTEEQINIAGTGTDWQDSFYNLAPVKNKTISVSGGSDKTKFTLSYGRFDQEGTIGNNKFLRNTLRAKINHDISDKLSVQLNTSYSETKNENEYASAGFRGNSVISAIFGAPPTLSPYDENGEYRELRYSYPFMSDGLLNPEAYIQEVSSISQTRNNTINLGVDYKPIKQLSINLSGNYINVDGRSDSYRTLNYPGSQGNGGIGISNVKTIASNNIVTYTNTLDSSHTFSVTGGVTYEESLSTGVGISGSGFLSDATENYAIGAANVVGVPSSSYTKWQLLSYLGRLNYSFDNKYYVTASFRSDGSSRYSEGNKWGYFPSAAVAYRISEENFMKNLPFISNLKLRAGYGETGSTAIAPYTTLNMLFTGKAIFGDSDFTTYEPTDRLPNSLRWESTQQTNVGMDISLFDGKIDLVADYYIKNTKDLLNSVQLPRSLGYSYTIQNIGEVQNKGLEFQLDAEILDRELKWNISSNISFNENKVVELYDDQDILAPGLNITVIIDYLNLIREGQPMNVFYGYQSDGYDENGNYKYIDIDQSGDITSDDRTYIGNPNPDFVYGFSSNLSWKNFDFDFFLQGSHGNDIYALGMAAQTIDFGMGLNTLKDVLYDHWTPENTNAQYPKISTATTPKISDSYVFDGSYLRLKNIQLGYNIPVEKLGIPLLQRGKVYISGQNLLTITKYPWQDPEINSFGGASSLRQGIDHYSYPVAKTFTFGFKLDF
ncbi:SusC/RagA family TonB-linked outer membrane protein [Kriegella aquimaris]|uniref:TonB-linked outer membrane protein, SusC/RagA family n=1 Tax=Kriegella aquimaris TaxID=192904 RepID=A0A1G9TP57_9FLAO|nr:TonB-dependent receptor [Kriegella aquimaris]SDM49441.1 TonB-linked outer membrane protein, SusC/RagA family [Kriegella aquimaris]